MNWIYWKPLSTVEYNMQLAGSELLGLDVASIGSSHTTDQVRSLLASEENRQRVVRQMAPNYLR